MIKLFAHVFNMSMVAGWLVLAILLLRLILRKAPKWIMVMLWGLVALRLLVPVFAQSSASLVPSTRTVSPQIMQESVPQLHTGVSVLNSAINPMIQQTQVAVSAKKTVNILHVITPILAGVWVVGCGILWACCLFSYIRLRRRVSNGVLLKGNIYESDQIDAAFLLGLFRPKIYLPFGLNPQEQQHIIAHEQAHIRRKDHLWKPFGFLLLTVYWFHPLMWLAYWLLCRDIELACDEKVAHTMDAAQRADYSQTLLNRTVKHYMISACPLAFGQGSVKRRVRSVLNYKKPTFWIIFAALVAAVVVSVCFLTDPPEKNTERTPQATSEPTEPEITEPSGALLQTGYLLDLETLKRKFPMYFDLPTDKGLEVYIWQMAEDTYYCGLLPGRNLEYTQEELWELHKNHTTMAEMRAIVDSYDLSRDMICVIPIQMPYSSYWYEIDDAYCDGLRQAFWDTLPIMTYFGPVTDTESFDIDGDGIIEHCSLSYGPTSGLFTFVLSVTENGELEYYQIFDGPAGSYWFAELENGENVLKFDPQTPINTVWEYGFAVVDGNIALVPLTQFAYDWSYWGPQGVK